ncbi:hypothetical protein [Kribbella sp. NPDC051718]|uniref:hypothetical protein n=1 Tax=Kribbella sp. NPDC051718 TaxID=3155168 RepID=UPI0034311AAD
MTHLYTDGPLTYLSPVLQASGVPVVTSVSAEQYLAYARDDFVTGTERGMINALGNTKRALHLMIDTLLQNYGLLAWNNKHTTFPQKLALLDSVGLISLKLFGKLNVQRNIVEHEYTVPLPDSVEDAIDVCHLLQLALGRLGQDITYQGVAGLRDSHKHVLMSLDALRGTIEFAELVDPEIRTHDELSIDYVSTTLQRGTRAADAGSIGEEVAPRLELSAKLLGTWAPYIKCLVEIQAGNSTRVTTRTATGSFTLWTGRTVPASLIDERGRELLDTLWGSGTDEQFV